MSGGSHRWSRFESTLEIWLEMLYLAKRNKRKSTASDVLDAALLASQALYDDVDMRRLLGPRAQLGEKLSKGCSCLLRFREVRTRTSALEEVQFSPRVRSQWDHFMWHLTDGEHHWRLVSKEHTVHMVGLRASKAEQRSRAPRAPQEAAFHFPLPPHAAYEDGGFPSQRITCGRGSMSMDFGGRCDIFWRRVETDDIADMYPYPLREPFMCVCSEPTRGVYIDRIVDCTNCDKAPIRRFLFRDGRPAEKWGDADFLLWDGRSLFHIHRFPSMMLSGNGASLLLFVDWDTFEMHAPFRVFTQTNTGCTHILDPYVGSHAAAYFCRLLNHYICHRIGDYPWCSDLTFRAYYNTPERFLAERMPISGIFDDLSSSGLAFVVSNPPFDIQTTDVLLAELRRIKALLDTQTVRVVLLSPPLCKWRSWLVENRMTVAKNEYIRSDVGGRGKGILRLKTPTMLYTNDTELSTTSGEELTQSDLDDATCAVSDDSSSTASVCGSIETLIQLEIALDDNKYAHGDRCTGDDLGGVCELGVERLIATAVTETSCRAKSKVAKRKQRLIFALAAPLVEGIEPLSIQIEFSALKDAMATHRDCLYLIRDLYHDAASRLSDKLLPAIFKPRLVPAIEKLMTDQFVVDANPFLSVISSYNAFLKRLCDFVTANDDVPGVADRCKEYLDQVVVIEDAGSKVVKRKRL